MAKLTISDAARVTGVSRVTLHRYIKAGKLSRMADGSIDTAELVRAGLVLHLETLPDTDPVTAVLLQDTPPSVTPPVAPVTAVTQAAERMIELLQRELDAAHTREQAAREREALLLQMLSQLQQQNQRLLEAPRQEHSVVSAPVAATQPPPAPRGAMRRRLVALLQEHPEGLSPVQTRQLLGIDKDLGSTMKAMARDGLLRRVETGRYVVA